MKYSKEFKLECVMKYKNREYIKGPPSVMRDNFIEQVRRWCCIYDSLGDIMNDCN